MRRNIIILALVVIVAGAGWYWEASDKKTDQRQIDTASQVAGDIPEAPSPKVNHYAPPFTLDALEGDAVYQVGGKRDKLLIINFWAAWCAPCEEEAPDLKDIYEKHHDKLDLYAVNGTKYDKLREAKDFVKEQELVFPILTDPDGTALDLYKVAYFPVSFIVDQDGVIRHRIEGIIDREQWEKYIQELI